MNRFQVGQNYVFTDEDEQKKIGTWEGEIDFEKWTIQLHNINDPSEVWIVPIKQIEKVKGEEPSMHPALRHIVMTLEAHGDSFTSEEWDQIVKKIAELSKLLDEIFEKKYREQIRDRR